MCFYLDKMKKLITSESVTEGHPDKICDQISDAILDSLIVQDPYSRVAVECMTTTGSIHVAGEVTTRGFVDVQSVARRVLKKIGYTDPKFGIDADDAGVWVSIHSQSPDISQGVNDGENKEQGAGDQGMMYGYACNETPELMPMPIVVAHKLTRKLAEVRKNNSIKNLGPDGKSQVTIEYEDWKPLRIEAVVIAQQHREEISEEELRKEIIEKVIKPVCGEMIDNNTKIHINATGRFVIGGPEGDTGVTGRKIIVDTYGGWAPHGGGAFSGKDPSKVDRSATYAARHIAKNVVAAGLASECLVQVAYAIGVAQPVSIFVDTKGTGKISDKKIADMIRKEVDLTPRGIIERLQLRRPIYQKTTAYGHFGRNEKEFTWEKLDLVSTFKKYIQ